jgi:hypothetical protein
MNNTESINAEQFMAYYDKIIPSHPKLGNECSQGEVCAENGMNDCRLFLARQFDVNGDGRFDKNEIEDLADFGDDFATATPETKLFGGDDLEEAEAFKYMASIVFAVTVVIIICQIISL